MIPRISMAVAAVVAGLLLAGCGTSPDVQPSPAGPGLDGEFTVSGGFGTQWDDLEALGNPGTVGSGVVITDNGPGLGLGGELTVSGGLGTRPSSGKGTGTVGSGVVASPAGPSLNGGLTVSGGLGTQPPAGNPTGTVGGGAVVR